MFSGLIGAIIGLIASSASVAGLIISDGKEDWEIILIIVGFEALGGGLSFLISRLISNCLRKKQNYPSQIFTQVVIGAMAASIGALYSIIYKIYLSQGSKDNEDQSVSAILLSGLYGACSAAAISALITIGNNWFFRNKISEIEFIYYIGNHDDGKKIWDFLIQTEQVKKGKIVSKQVNLEKIRLEIYNEDVESYFGQKDNILHNIRLNMLISFLVAFVTGCALSHFDQRQKQAQIEESKDLQESVDQFENIDPKLKQETPKSSQEKQYQEFRKQALEKAAEATETGNQIQELANEQTTQLEKDSLMVDANKSFREAEAYRNLANKSEDTQSNINGMQKGQELAAVRQAQVLMAVVQNTGVPIQAQKSSSQTKDKVNDGEQKDQNEDKQNHQAEKILEGAINKTQSNIQKNEISRGQQVREPLLKDD
ncbi:UNKNOWN [Stylonychia lemnae]|uniref:Uncharacterized protein n=1 Tax=Stylonychia lemnae TaxID=5949 RepID=A0A077ZQV2_STYLE|nr:UNKNOWN [Stylonychia lemnae]|eukprot:CDW72282.1 UNKNOWN [Stylonychia lemnae]